MKRLQPRPSRTDTLFPITTLVRSLELSVARSRYDSHHGVIEDVSASGMLTTGSTDLPVGIGFADTAHDFRVERCFMRHFQWKRRDNQYWNGDGFSTERGNARFLFPQCPARDTSDGGFDPKSTETLHAQ